MFFASNSYLAILDGNIHYGIDVILWIYYMTTFNYNIIRLPKTFGSKKT